MTLISFQAGFTYKSLALIIPEISTKSPNPDTTYLRIPEEAWKAQSACGWSCLIKLLKGLIDPEQLWCVLICKSVMPDWSLIYTDLVWIMAWLTDSCISSGLNMPDDTLIWPDGVWIVWTMTLTSSDLIWALSDHKHIVLQNYMGVVCCIFSCSYLMIHSKHLVYCHNRHGTSPLASSSNNMKTYNIHLFTGNYALLMHVRLLVCCQQHRHYNLSCQVECPQPTSALPGIEYCASSMKSLPCLGKLHPARRNNLSATCKNW